MLSKALFLDRDGVINIEKNYIYKISDFEFIDGVFETCKYFQDKGYLIIIITNQAGIARDLYTKDDFNILTDWMLEKFNKECIKITDVYYCPHHPKFTGECQCRKPNPGMILDAQKKYNIKLDDSILVGDKISDINAGINAGITKNYLISTGHKIDDNETYKLRINNLKELIK